MRIVSIVFLNLAFLLDATNVLAIERTWTDITGKFEVKAELLSYEEDLVILKMATGKQLSVDFSKLSEEDRKYVVKQMAKSDNGLPVKKDDNNTRKDDERDIRRIALKYYASMRSSDIQALKQLLVVFPVKGSKSRPLSLWPEYSMRDEEKQNNNVIHLRRGYKPKFRIGKAKIEGDEATVPVVTVAFGQHHPHNLYLKRVGNEWKISGYQNVTINGILSDRVNYEDFAVNNKARLRDRNVNMASAEKATLEDKDFRGLNWGDPPSNDMYENFSEKVAKLSESREGSIGYRKHNEKLKIGDVTIQSVDYFFDNNRFTEAIVFVGDSSTYDEIERITAFKELVLLISAVHEKPQAKTESNLRQVSWESDRSFVLLSEVTGYEGFNGAEQLNTTIIKFYDIAYLQKVTEERKIKEITIRRGKAKKDL